MDPISLTLDLHRYRYQCTSTVPLPYRYLKFNAGSPSNIRGPHVNILHLPAFKEQTLLAVLHLGNFVDNKEVLLLLHLRVGLGVRHHATQIVQQMPPPEGGQKALIKEGTVGT